MGGFLLGLLVGGISVTVFASIIALCWLLLA